MQHYSETEPYGTVALDGPIVPATNSHYVNNKSHTDWIQAFGKIQPTNHLSYTTACKVHKHPLK
jgi:hypothetical protein